MSGSSPSQDLAQYRARVVGAERSAHPVLGDRDDRLPKRPAAPSGPGVVVEPYLVAEDLSRLAAQHRPGDHDVAGRIADAGCSEVDDRGETAAGDEKIAVRD